MTLSWIARGAASAERGRRLMELRGVTPNGHPLWAPWEVQQVLDIYPEYRSIFPLLDRRTRPAVYGKAGRLGITTRRPQSWIDNEIIRLRKVYPHGTRAEILAAFPGRSYAAVAKAATSRNIFRARKPLVSTGSRLLDQVLERARMLNYTMIDLDRFGRSKNYFSKRKWRTKLNEAVHCHAARAMGGVLRAAFG